MKQGKRFLRLLPLLVALVCLFRFGGAAVIGRLELPQRVAALYTERKICTDVTGVVVRDEILLTSCHTETVPLLPEGEKVACGQTVAMGVSDLRSGARLREQITAECRMQQLRLASEREPRTQSGEIRSLLVTLAADPLRGDTERLKTLILGCSAEPVRLQEELRALTAVWESSAMQTAGTPLTAEEPGWFSNCTDGYEAVLTPEWLRNADCEEPFPQPQPVDKAVYGKLIRSETWYFAADLPHAQLHGLKTGDTVTAEFGSSLVGTVVMRVERLQYSGSGTCRLILSCDRKLAQVTALRQQTCTLILHTYSGLLVPRAAVCHNQNGQAGVYVLEGALARWKPVEILYTEESACVVKLDRTDTDNLWPEDEILLGNNLYDGKVVYP